MTLPILGDTVGERGERAAAHALDERADVVVVGAGMAGYCCAIEAAMHGASVILLEKEPAPGGSSILSGGSFAFAGTGQQRAAGIEDTTDRLLDDLRAVGRGYADDLLLQAFGQEQLAAWRWLQSLGLQFGRPKVAAGQSVPRTHRTDPHRMFELLDAAAARTGRVTLRRSTAATRLIRNGVDGAVIGVAATEGQSTFQIGAQRAVVLATGGFMRSEALLEKFAPAQASALRMGGAGCTGDGLLMAWHLGADLRDVGFIKSTFGIHPDAGPEDHHFLHAIYMGAIAVNRLGRRFVNESLSYKLVGDACLIQPGAVGFQIFDRVVVDLAPTDGSSFDVANELRAGRLIQAPSLAALAARLGIESAELQATVARYNKAVAEGADREFGRTSLSSGWGRLVSLEHPPFYGYPSRSAVVGTYCGLVVDRGMHVRDVFGASIANLLAAGHVTGGFHGAGYMTGTALTKAVVFGRIAGRTAAGV